MNEEGQSQQESGYFSNFKTIYTKLRKRYFKKQPKVQTKNQIRDKKFKISVEHMNKMEEEYIGEYRPQSNELILNIYSYDCRTATYKHPFPVFIEKDKKVKDLDRVIKLKIGLYTDREDFQIYFGKFRLEKNSRLSSIELKSGHCIIFKPRQVRFPPKNSMKPGYSSFGSMKSGARIFKKIKKKKTTNFSGHSMTPVVSLDIYKTSPTYLQLCRMNEKQLSSVENFKIWNKHGEIEFLDDVDLRHLNLDRIISIQPKYIEVYPEEYYQDNKNKPIVGLEMNVPARLTFNSMGVRNIEENPKKLKRLRAWIGNLPYTNRVKFVPQEDKIVIVVKHF